MFVRRVKVTNLQNVGWISADRGTRATLMRTIPRSLFKSYTKDLSLPIFELVIRHRLHRILVCTGPSPYYDLEHAREHAYCYSWEHQGKQTYRRFSSMDSGLEAFSRNPTHGSFSALTFQSTELTNYVNQRFLSYWIGLLLRRPLHQ